MILLGFASVLRRSELAALTLADVEVEFGAVMLAIRRSKTDQHATTDPIAALDAWLAIRGTKTLPWRVDDKRRLWSGQPVTFRISPP